MENLVNNNIAIMPLWMWGVFFYGLLSMVCKFSGFLCNGKKKRSRKRG